MFLSLVRLGIGNETPRRLMGYGLPSSVDWSAVKAIAEQQGLLAIVMDGIDRLLEDKRPPKPVLLQWIGEILQGFECRYELYCRAIAEMAAFYNEHGFKMMLLKGYACSMDWPKPDHRPCGDIDIWLFGRQKEADTALAQKKGIKIDASHHVHKVFHWRGFTVENHYAFVNIHAHKSNRKLEIIFKELGEDDSHTVEVYGERVYLPSANLHALFLIRHIASHFASASINLRQVLDWGFFVQKHTKEVNWDWLTKLLKDYHMNDFFNCIKAICVEDLGFAVSIFPMVQFEPNLKERILNDIMSPQFNSELPKSLITRLVFKVKRWNSNAWKRELCFGENSLASLFESVKSHLLKPSTI